MMWSRRGVRSVSRGPIAIGTVVFVSIVGGACGVPVDDGPRTIDPEDLPAALTDVTDPSTTTSRPLTPADAARVVLLYYVNGGQLAPAIEVLDGPVTIDAVMAALEAGPPDQLAEEGYRSALSPSDVVAAVRVVRGVARVDLLPAIETLATTDQVLAIGQLVMTLTARPGVGQVRFTVDGTRVDVPTADGTLVPDAVTRDDFTSLLAEE